MKKRGRKSSKQTFGEYIEATATKTSNDLVMDIDELTRELYRRREDPQTVSEILLELSAKNTGLGNYLIEALDEERSLETIYKWSVDKLKIDLMGQVDPNSKKGDNYTATAAESQAKLECHHMLEELNITRKSVEILKIKRSDLDKVLDIGRSRLSLIKDAIRGA